MKAVINGRAIPVQSYQENTSQDSVPEFEVVVQSSALFGLAAYLQGIAIERDGVTLQSGIIRSPNPFPKFAKGAAQPLLTTLKCDGELGRLECEAGIDVHFQDTLLSVAIQTLLAGTTLSTWTLNDISTLTDVEITVDVRGKRTIWSQIQEIVKQARNVTYVRFGGVAAGVFLLDIGAFNARDHRRRVIYGQNVVDEPRFRAPTVEPLFEVRPIGGDSADTPVNLDDALALDPTLSNPAQDYQILPGTGFVRNNTIAAGCRATIKYQVQKTENNEAPTEQERQESALSLYRKTAREMEQSAPYISFSIKYVSDVPPVIHDAIFVRATVFEEVVDLLTERIELIPTLTVENWFRVQAIKAQYETRITNVDALTEQVTYADVFEITASSRDDIDKYNESELVFNQVERFDNFDTVDAANGVYARLENTLTEGPGVPGDCNFQGIGPGTGRLFVFTPPPLPAGATTWASQIVSVTIGYGFEVVQTGAVGQPLEICVSNGGVWGLGDTADVTISWIAT